MTTSDNEWQQMTTSDNERSFRLILLFFWKREESTTKLFKTERGPWSEERYWINNRKNPPRKNVNSKKQLFVDFLENRCSKNFLQYSQENIFVGVSFNIVAGLQACNPYKKRFQRQYSWVISFEYLPGWGNLSGK